MIEERKGRVFQVKHRGVSFILWWKCLIYANLRLHVTFIYLCHDKDKYISLTLIIPGFVTFKRSTFIFLSYTWHSAIIWWYLFCPRHHSPTLPFPSSGKPRLYFLFVASCGWPHRNVASDEGLTATTNCIQVKVNGNEEENHWAKSVSTSLDRCPY